MMEEQKVENKYARGKIYKIVGGGLTYYGSTCEKTLAMRMSKHGACYKHFKSGKGLLVYSFNIFDNCNDCDIVLVENFPCNNKDELHARERYYIENNECVNKNIPTRTMKEYREEHKEKYILYYEANKDILKVKHKQHYEENKEILKVKHKKHYEDNKEKINEQHKLYYLKNKEIICLKNHDNYNSNEEVKLKKKAYHNDNKETIRLKNNDYREKNKEKIKNHKSEIVLCNCGKSYTNAHKHRHFKTKYHINNI